MISNQVLGSMDHLANLLASVQVLNDSILGIRNGSPHQIIPLSGQLRALLLEGRKDSVALLLELASYLGHDLKVYSMPDSEAPLPPSVPEPLVFVSGLPFSLRRELPSQVKLSIPEFLKRKIIKYGQNHFDVSQLIRWFANKAGGAHYSRSWPEELVALMKLPVIGRQGLQNVLMQVAKVTAELAVLVFRELSDEEFFVQFWIPGKCDKPTVFFDTRLPDSVVGWALGCDKVGRIFVELTGIDGRPWQFVAEHCIEWGQQLHHLRFSRKLHQDLSTEVSIWVDGEQVFTNRLRWPIVVPNGMSNCNSYLNCTSASTSTGGTLFLRQVFACRPTTESELAKAILAASRAWSPSTKGILLSKGVYGHSPVGSRDYKFSGSAFQKSFKGALRYLEKGPPAGI
ncbi:MAG: hypothetical protein R3B54_06165 [Bdellovibrionota bacterium]